MKTKVNCLYCSFERFPIDKCQCKYNSEKQIIEIISVNEIEDALITMIDNKRMLGVK